VSVSLGADRQILLEGSCGSEDAESLLQLLLSMPGAVVDWQRCSMAHAAVLQVLLAARPTLRGTPRGEELARWVGPALARLDQ
jgi:hypothetical protein